MVDDNQSLVTVVPQVKRPVGRPPKHGAYSKFALANLETIKIQEIKDIMSGEQIAIAPADAIYVTMLGRIMAQMELLDRYYQGFGYFQDEGRGQIWPSVPHYLNLAKQAARMLEQLGMTPSARYKLGKELAQTEDIATKIWRARQE